MSKLLNVSASPHVRSKETTQSIMADVCIAMLPAAAFGVFQFGFHALLVLIVTVAACVLSEYVFQKLLKLPLTVSYRTELYEPGSGRKMFSPDLLCRENVRFYHGRLERSYSSGTA